MCHIDLNVAGRICLCDGPCQRAFHLGISQKSSRLFGRDSQREAAAEAGLQHAFCPCSRSFNELCMQACLLPSAGASSRWCRLPPALFTGQIENLLLSAIVAGIGHVRCLFLQPSEHQSGVLHPRNSHAALCLLWQPFACNKSCLWQGSSAVPQLTSYTIFCRSEKPAGQGDKRCCHYFAQDTVCRSWRIIAWTCSQAATCTDCPISLMRTPLLYTTAEWECPCEIHACRSLQSTLWLRAQPSSAPTAWRRSTSASSASRRATLTIVKLSRECYLMLSIYKSNIWMNGM